MLYNISMHVEQEPHSITVAPDINQGDPLGKHFIFAIAATTKELPDIHQPSITIHDSVEAWKLSIDEAIFRLWSVAQPLFGIIMASNAYQALQRPDIPYLQQEDTLLSVVSLAALSLLSLYITPYIHRRANAYRILNRWTRDRNLSQVAMAHTHQYRDDWH